MDLLPLPDKYRHKNKSKVGTSKIPSMLVGIKYSSHLDARPAYHNQTSIPQRKYSFTTYYLASNLNQKCSKAKQMNVYRTQKAICHVTDLVFGNTLKEHDSICKHICKIQRKKLHCRNKKNYIETDQSPKKQMCTFLSEGL